MCSSNICTLEKNEKQYIILLYFIHRKFQRISNPGIKRNTWWTFQAWWVDNSNSQLLKKSFIKHLNVEIITYITVSSTAQQTAEDKPWVGGRWEPPWWWRPARRPAAAQNRGPGRAAQTAAAAPIPGWSAGSSGKREWKIIHEKNTKNHFLFPKSLKFRKKPVIDWRNLERS